MLSYSLVSDAINGSVIIEGSFATYTPNADFNGSDSFTFSVSDGELTDQANITVAVNPINDAPILATIADISFEEGGLGNINLLATDADNDNLTYSIAGGTNITGN